MPYEALVAGGMMWGVRLAQLQLFQKIIVSTKMKSHCRLCPQKLHVNRAWKEVTSLWPTAISCLQYLESRSWYCVTMTLLLQKGTWEHPTWVLLGSSCWNSKPMPNHLTNWVIDWDSEIFDLTFNIPNESTNSGKPANSICASTFSVEDFQWYLPVDPLRFLWNPWFNPYGPYKSLKRKQTFVLSSINSPLHSNTFKEGLFESSTGKWSFCEFPHFETPSENKAPDPTAQIHPPDAWRWQWWSGDPIFSAPHKKKKIKCQLFRMSCACVCFFLFFFEGSKKISKSTKQEKAPSKFMEPPSIHRS